MVDSRMVPRYQRHWHEFDISETVKLWHKRPRRNLGLVIEVEDEDRNKLRANQIFRMMNCLDGEKMFTFLWTANCPNGPLAGNTKGGSITVPLTSCLIGLELAV
jgi:hypothetical protein